MNPPRACLPIYLFYYIQFCSLLCCLSLSYVIVFYLIMCYFILSFYSLLSYLTLSYLVQFLSPPTTSYMLISCFSFSPFIPHLHFCLSLPALHLSPSLFPYVYPPSSPPPIQLSVRSSHSGWRQVRSSSILQTPRHRPALLVSHYPTPHH